nr:ankyrin repeat domain-containing protein 54 isoform X1 [Nothobranchius furzeri]XP_054589308.1 ankyrin repeat domain-containing protein 54 isoform X1 [Nothobranchius furzeri]
MEVHPAECHSDPTGHPVQDQNQEQASCLDQNWAQLDQVSAPAHHNEAEESAGSVSKATESGGAPAAQRADRPADLLVPAAASGHGGDATTCCDLLSLRSGSFSLTSEPGAFCRSEEDDARSITASSIISVFQRVPMDPLEKDWLRSCTLGNVSVQRLLLAQDPNLVMKKTALHWAAKQGRLDSVDMMLHYGADVNVRSGYTALHLASIHGHQDIVQTLISSHNAKTNIRDYHGKMAIQYWTCTRPGTTSIFNQEPALSDGGRFSQERRTQRFALPSLRLSRSRSHGQLHLDFGALPSASCDALDLHV